MRNLCLIALSLLAGCSTCQQLPAIHKWSVAEQEKIAAERNALPAGDVLRGALQEWEDTRQALK